MELSKKAFLFVVGVVSLTIDEVNKSIKEAIESVEEQREKINKRFVKEEA